MFKILPLNVQHTTEEIFNYSVPTVENNYMDNHTFFVVVIALPRFRIGLY